jgi:hypothetical protein
MSLGKLLTTGKSLVGLHNSGVRYQLRKGALPKFESAKNPFAARTQAESSTTNPARGPELPKLTPAEAAAAGLKKTQPLSVLGSLIAVREAAVDAKRNSQPAEPPKVAAPVDSWLKKINPLVWLGNRKPAEPESPIQRFGKSRTPVQGELSLDNIKVMRNDLSDTDLEVVSMKARPARLPSAPPQASASAAAMAIPDLPPARTAWELLGEHLMGRH